MKTATSYCIRTLLIVASVSRLSLAQYGGGQGTPEDPYLIVTVSHLRTLSGDSANWDKHFQLLADLDLSGTFLDPIARGAAFTGVFDGNGHILSHFACAARWPDDIGLFGSIGTEGTVMNLGVTDVATQGGDDVGGLAGYNAGTITGCFTTGRCVDGRRVGGLVGENDGLISRCYSTAEVSGEFDVGGLVGELSEGLLIECYSTGRVSSTGAYDVGGLVGMNWLCTVTGCFWDTQSSGFQYSDGGTGKTTAQMQSMQTFQSAGWDFIFANDGPDDAWAMPPGGGYPILWWQAESLPPLSAFGGGTGVLDDPYLVTTADHLNAIGSNPRLMDRCYKLTADIDLITVVPTPVGGAVCSFAGKFDGAGHQIRHWTSGSLYGGGSALFSSIGKAGLVENVAVTDVNIAGGYTVGALGGKNEGTIRNCCCSGSVSGYGTVGGLVGDNAGCLVRCYSEAAVSQGHGLSGYAGGLVARNEGTIEDCYATGGVSASSGYAACLAGSNTGLINCCYATGLVSGTSGKGAGLVYQSTGVVFNCFWDIDSSGQQGGAGGKGRHTAEMKQSRTFLGWNSCGELVWTCEEGLDYPRLAWEARHGPALPLHTLADFLPGSGTPEDPYLIATPEEFVMVGKFPSEWDRAFQLLADLDLSACQSPEYDPIGFDSLHAFSGALDGAGHCIRDWIYITSGDDVGLFGYLGPTGSVRGLHLDNCIVAGSDRVGGLAGSNSGKLTDCHVAALVCATGQEAGLLVGRCQAGAVASCSATGSCTAYFSAGGLLGALRAGKVTSCGAEAVVVGDYFIGGLIGTNQATVTLCRAAGTVAGDRGAGGLIGVNSTGGSVSDSYSLALVTAGENVGGLVGEVDAGSVSRCYAAGPVVGGGDTAGGLAGGDVYSGGAILTSFWDITATGQASGRGGLGKVTAQMQTASTFTASGWDFENVWTICEGKDYPRLKWENIDCNGLAGGGLSMVDTVARDK
jgi:hypothetical protein